MEENTPAGSEVRVEVVGEERPILYAELKKELQEVDEKLDMLSPKADKADYIVAAASGLLCGMRDVFGVGGFDLSRGRDIAAEDVSTFVKKTAQKLGYNGSDIDGAVKFLEGKFPIPADGNTSDFGGGLQHHLRDFAHHPTLLGLFFSILTQFTGFSFGTDKTGAFRCVPVKSKDYIGKNIPDKLIKGTVWWFFHLVSDMAGSSATAALSGGTGIPGPLLALAKEISALPIFKNTDSAAFLMRVFNGTIFAQRDENGRLIRETAIRFDLRGELGALYEMGRQALPVLANECIVRAFYFIRRLVGEIRRINPRSPDDLGGIEWRSVVPAKNPTITRMLVVATGVFTAADVTGAVVTEKYLLSVNYVGVVRFAIALGSEMVYVMKRRDLKKLRDMYLTIERSTFDEDDRKKYERIAESMGIDKFGITLEQTEILYNLEYLKTRNDIAATSSPINREAIKSLKRDWLREWKMFMEAGFEDFTGLEGAKLHWYDREELLRRISGLDPEKPWLRLVLLEAMIFEPYFPLSVVKNKKGEEKPSPKYKTLENRINGYSGSMGDLFLDSLFGGKYGTQGFIPRIRKTYNKVINELNEVLKRMLVTLVITAAVALVAVFTAGVFAPGIAVELVGAQFAGLHGAALVSACLAYIGGGAIAAGGFGMAGGITAIVGGGALIGMGVGAGAGAAVGNAAIVQKKNAILQSAKLVVSIREVFLNDEHDMQYSKYVYEEYVRMVADSEKELVDIKLRAENADKSQRKELEKLIKEAEASIAAMKIAMRNLKRFYSSFAEGMKA